MSSALGGGEGGLCVRAEIEAGVIVAVDLSSTRPIGLSGALVGRDVDAAMALLPRLFGLCGIAQAVAGLTATETALGIVAAPSQLAARHLLVTVEALEQTVWRLLLDWPRCVGAKPALDSLKRLRRRLSAPRPGLFPDPTWNRIGGARLTPDSIELAAWLDGVETEVRQSIFGLAPGEDWPLNPRRAFERWLRAAATPVATTLRQVRAQGLASFGHSAVAPLPAFDADAIGRRLAADDGFAFCARPDLEGMVYETGALARLWRHPLIAALRADHGNGLFTRLAARVVESHALLAELRRCLTELAAHPGTTPTVTATGAGLGVVESARGRLVHRVAVAEGRVRDYKILAPTEWNFHPNGPLARGLLGAHSNQVSAIHRAVTLLATALDPCVGFELTVAERQ